MISDSWKLRFETKGEDKAKGNETEGKSECCLPFKSQWRMFLLWRYAMPSTISFSVIYMETIFGFDKILRRLQSHPRSTTGCVDAKANPRVRDEFFPRRQNQSTTRSSVARPPHRRL